MTGRWSGTFESSWGVQPASANLTNERGTLNISGDFTVDGQRASGTVSGMLETRRQIRRANVLGIADHLVSDGCRRNVPERECIDYTSGTASEKTVDLFAQGFPKGNCPDPPTNVHIALRR